MSRLFSYVVARDYGFAPNPYFGWCSLATCKPKIRKTANVGDWVVGTGSKKNGLSGRIIFVMKVSEVLSYTEFWEDARFVDKRPQFMSSIKKAFGDNIYHKDHLTGEWVQEDSHHSLPDGSTNHLNLDHDTKCTSVLLGQRFTYWGKNAIELPSQFRNWNGVDLCTTRGHKSRFDEELVTKFVEWYNGLNLEGLQGTPLEWEGEVRRFGNVEN